MSFGTSRFKGRLPKTCVNAFASALYSFEGALRLLQRAKGQRPGHRGGVAQLGEHLLCKQGVIGSNPFISTNPYVGWRMQTTVGRLYGWRAGIWNMGS